MAPKEIVTLEGELDFRTAFEVELRIEEAIKRDDHVVVDLRGVTFIDSTGLGALIESRRHPRVEGVTFELIPGPPAVQQVFEISGLLDELPFVR